MDKKTYLQILESALLYFEGVKQEELVSKHEIPRELVFQGMAICDSILNQEYQQKYDPVKHSNKCATCGELLAKEDKQFHTIENKSFCETHYNEQIALQQKAAQVLREIEK